MAVQEMLSGLGLVGLLVLLAAVFYGAVIAKKTGGGQRAKSSAIGDNFETLAQVQSALRKAGLESSDLIVGVDFTKSNTWTGERSFGGRSLHALDGDIKNPYERAISVIGRTLEDFDDDNLIPAYGFGDRATTDKRVFSLSAGAAPCAGFGAVLDRYREAASSVTLSGPTSFVPLIEQAVQIVRETGSYHILLIVADGQVSNRQANVDAIVAASEYALSIVMVGVGDGPWDEMIDFDDNLPDRKFDNFQFVRADGHRSDASFALAALMEIPEQFKIIRAMGLLGHAEGGGGAAAARVAATAPLASHQQRKKKDC